MNEEKLSLKRIVPLLAVIFLSGLIFLSIKNNELAGTIINRRLAGNEPILTAHAYLVKAIGDKPRPLTEEYSTLRQSNTVDNYALHPALSLKGLGKRTLDIPKERGKNYLLKRREWKKLPQASLTKLLTGALAEEKLSPEDWVTFSKEAKAIEPKISGVREGESLLRDDVLRLALMESDNDAALALAQAVGEKMGATSPQDAVLRFMQLMEQKGTELGLENSKFENPIGLDNKNHYSSAEDLAKIAEYVWYNHPNLWEISKTIDTVVYPALWECPALLAQGYPQRYFAAGCNAQRSTPPLHVRAGSKGGVYSDAGHEYKIINTNELLKEFPAILGGKTGFTDNAKGALLLLYPVKPDQVAIIVILGSDDRFEDGRKIIQWIEGL